FHKKKVTKKKQNRAGEVLSLLKAVAETGSDGQRHQMPGCGLDIEVLPGETGAESPAAVEEISDAHLQTRSEAAFARATGDETIARGQGYIGLPVEWTADRCLGEQLQRDDRFGRIHGMPGVGCGARKVVLVGQVEIARGDPRLEPMGKEARD